MFTVQQIDEAHKSVKSGADFPKYIQEIKGFGVESFDTFVSDSHTEYHGANDFVAVSGALYEALEISENYNDAVFTERLKAHQNGETDYFTFCKDCARTGVFKWIVDLSAMTCIYYDLQNQQVLVENIPS